MLRNRNIAIIKGCNTDLGFTKDEDDKDHIEDTVLKYAYDDTLK